MEQINEKQVPIVENNEKCKEYENNENEKSLYYKVDCEYVKEIISARKYITVFRKKSTFKGATDNDYWYSATREDGCSVIMKFKNEVPKGLGSAFIVFDIYGNAKKKNVEYKGEEYTNYTYYIEKCGFSDCPSVELPF